MPIYGLSNSSAGGNPSNLVSPMSLLSIDNTKAITSINEADNEMENFSSSS
jgi:hypothetical protein